MASGGWYGDPSDRSDGPLTLPAIQASEFGLCFVARAVASCFVDCERILNEEVFTCDVLATDYRRELFRCSGQFDRVSVQ